MNYFVDLVSLKCFGTLLRGSCDVGLGLDVGVAVSIGGNMFTRRFFLSLS